MHGVNIESSCDEGMMKVKKYSSSSEKISNCIISVSFILLCVVLCATIAPARLKEISDAASIGTFAKDFSSDFESKINTEFHWKNYFVDINGFFHRLFLQREMNDVVLLKNGHEHITMEDRSDEGIAINADSLKAFSDWLDDKGISFFWCQVPQKLDEENDQLPAGLNDYSNRIADIFINDLRERNVNYLDLRECIEKDGVDRYSLFLSTEHHWKPQGGFYAFQKMCDYMRDNFGEEIPEYVTDIENYDIETHKKGSLGYYGQRVGWMFGGFDDFDLIYPKWETHQSSWAPHKDLLREGSFYDAIFYTEYLDYPWRERGLYGTYIGGDWPLVVHESDTAPIDKTVMILIDSYGTIPESFLTLAYKNVIGVDLRWVLRNNMGKTTAEFVEEYKPDIVIVSFNPNQIGDPESEQFQYGIEQVTEEP